LVVRLLGQRGLRLTQAGERFEEATEAALGALATGIRLARNDLTPEPQAVHLECGTAFARRTLPVLYVMFREKHRR